LRRAGKNKIKFTKYLSVLCAPRYWLASSVIAFNRLIEPTLHSRITIPSHFKGRVIGFDPIVGEKITLYPRIMKRTYVAWISVLVIAGTIASSAVFALVSPEMIDLKSASHFVVLSGTGITSTGGGLFHGDIGTSPITGAAIIGITTAQMHGVIYTVDAAGPAGSVMDAGRLTEAKNDLAAAISNAAARAPAVPVVGGDLAGTWLPGLYKDDGAPASLALTGTMILDAQGDPEAVWIFQSTSTLITEINSRVILTNGAQAGHVFWLVGSSVTLKGNTNFKGTILAITAITMNSGTELTGRALALNTAVTFNGAFITLSVPDAPEFTEIYRLSGDATVVTLTTTPMFELSLQTSTNLIRPNWKTLNVDTPVAGIWSYTDITDTANVTLRFYRAMISE